MAFKKLKNGYPIRDLRYRIQLNETLTCHMWECVQNINAVVNQVDFTQQSSYRTYLAYRRAMPLYDYPESNMIRVGNEFDGGYIMDSNLSITKIAYSIGIDKDVSWDEDMAKRGYEVFQYDHTIDALPKILPQFHWKKQGIGETDTADFRRLDTMLSDNSHKNLSGMLLKMDVEGAEWASLDAVDIHVLEQFDQIVMEIHDLTDMQQSKRILRVLKKLSEAFYMIHIHGNNCVNVCFCGNTITPNCCEITLLNRKKAQLQLSSKHLPIALDNVNIPGIPEISLQNWNI